MSARTQDALRPGVIDMRAELAQSAAPTATANSVLKVLSLDDVLNYDHTPESLLVGDGVIEAGGITLLFGAPGSFKGFAIGHLMACGAWGSGRWLGFDIKSRFASLWVNCENGRRRLKSQMQRMHLPPDAKDHIHISEIPAVWSLSDPSMVAALRQEIVSKNIRLLILDTVSNFAGDEMAKDFGAFFAALNTVLHGLPWKVAALLIHHARKPKDSDKGGRGLLHLISGHQTLQRRSRCILFIGRVTEELGEQRVVSVCLKCSDSGEMEHTKTAMQLDEHAMLTELPSFDWTEWTDGATTKPQGPGREPKVTADHLRQVFATDPWLTQSAAAEKLATLAQVGRSTAYQALKLHGGRHSDILSRRDDGMIGLVLDPFE